MMTSQCWQLSSEFLPISASVTGDSQAESTMAYYDQQEHDNTDAEFFFEYLETQGASLPKSVEDLFFQYSCYHAGIIPSTVPCTALSLLHALRRLGIISSWRDIVWASPSTMVNMQDIHQDQTADSGGLENTKQRGRERRRQNRRKNQWRPIAGVLEGATELQIDRPSTGKRDEGLWKPTGSDGEENIVWCGRDKLPESSHSLGMESLTMHDSQKEKNTKIVGLKESTRKAPGLGASHKDPLSGASQIVTLASPSYIFPAADPLYKESRDGFVSGTHGLDSIDLLNKGLPLKDLQHNPSHHELRGQRAEKKSLSGGFGACDTSQIPHLASTNDFLGLPLIPYYAGQDRSSELVDSFYMGPLCYDYDSCHRGQFTQFTQDLLGVHSPAPENNWRSSYLGYPVNASKFTFDNSQGSTKQKIQSDGGWLAGKRAGNFHRGGRGRKSNAHRNGRPRGGYKGKGVANQISKCGDTFTILDRGEDSKQQIQSDGGRLAGKRAGNFHRGGRGRKSNAHRNGHPRGGYKGKRVANQSSKHGDAFTILDRGKSSKQENGTEKEKDLDDFVPTTARRQRQWKASQEAGKDVFVSQPFSQSHDRPQTINIGATEGASISVVNNGAEAVKLLAVKMLLSSPKGSFSLSLAPPSPAPLSTEKCIPVMDVTKSVLKSQNGVLPGGPWVLGPGLHLTFKLGCTAAAMGLHRAVLLFDIGSQKIVRYITLICEDEIARSMAPIEPYARLPLPRIRSFYKYIPGVPPPLPFFKKRLKFYPIPPDVKEAILRKETPPVLLEGLQKDNYVQYFSYLEHAEELQMEVDIRAYDMQNATMWKVSHVILGLKVPGLAERRPSVIYRDKIYVRPSGTTAREFQGYVHKVQVDQVHLRFSDAFHASFCHNSHYDIRFSFGRVNIRRAHQGIHAAKALLDYFLFPTTPVQLRTEPAKKIVPVNRAINIEQMNAVSEILRRKGAPPYLIYGPPGTGKTVTVVEAILQVRKAYPNACILACAPSNSASDLLLERLIGAVEKRDMLRLNAYTRSLDEVPPHILPFCLLENNFFCTPDQASLMKYRVVVTTYWSAAMLDAQEIQPGHFTHIFLDEAGQGTEPEAMVPIGNLANPNTVVVLAGDHQQLGPLIRSPVALKFGLDKSYLERLSSLTTYLPASANGRSLGYNNSLVTKLVRNYRSHPAILSLPSCLFYDGELMACADESRNSLAEWDELPNKGFPVVFIGIEGHDEREGTSPSWFNAQEASKVVEIVKKVKDYRRSRVSLKDIGVISPYNQQVNKLKKAFLSQNLSDVKVGTVEAFQGQEKRVIIISTVRSSKEYVEFDKKHNLGFLTNPKRFNVAITRAKALLIIVGNPCVLSQDRCWNELLRYCRENNSYTGCTPPSDDINEESKQLHSPLIDNWFDVEVSGDNSGLPHSLKAAVEDLPWPDGTC